jgi:hypothetical protein
MIEVPYFKVGSAFAELVSASEITIVGDIREIPHHTLERVIHLEVAEVTKRALHATRAALTTKGACVVDFSALPRSSATDRTVETVWLCKLGEVFRVFINHPLWKPISVRFDVAPERAEGIGDNPLHIDFVNAEAPPQVVGLYCVRPDPMGGGASIVSNLCTAAASLSSESRNALSRRVFRDGRVENLMNVGADANPFRVLDDDFVRFTAKMIPSLPSGTAVRTAIEELSGLLTRQAHLIHLQAWQLLLVNQRIMAHGRTCLGPNQEGVPAGERRLVEQIFVRLK